MTPTRVAVIGGGRNCEHTVSLASAAVFVRTRARLKRARSSVPSLASVRPLHQPGGLVLARQTD